MQNFKITIINTLIVFGLASGLTLSIAEGQVAHASAADLGNAIKSCAQITDSLTRLDCFDAISKQLSEGQIGVEDQTNAASKPEEPSPNSSTTEITNAVGGSEFSRDKESGPEVYTAKVSRCQQGADGRWFFIFSNQQVWKQVKNNSRRYRNCNFDVTISKDIFGYVMQRQDNERKIRVKRIK